MSKILSRFSRLDFPPVFDKNNSFLTPIKDKDISKFDMIYKQTLDRVRSRADWVLVSFAVQYSPKFHLTTATQRSTDDILEWLEKRKGH